MAAAVGSSSEGRRGPSDVLAVASCGLAAAALAFTCLRLACIRTDHDSSNRTWKWWLPRSVRRISSGSQLVKGEYDRETYISRGGISGGAHGWRRVYGLLRPTGASEGCQGDALLTCKDSRRGVAHCGTSILPESSATVAVTLPSRSSREHVTSSSGWRDEPNDARVPSPLSSSRCLPDTATPPVAPVAAPPATVLPGDLSLSYISGSHHNSSRTGASIGFGAHSSQRKLQQQISLLVGVTATASHHRLSSPTSVDVARAITSASSNSSPRATAKQSKVSGASTAAAPPLALGAAVAGRPSAPSSTTIAEQLQTLERRRQHQWRLTQAAAQGGEGATALPTAQEGHHRAAQTDTAAALHTSGIGANAWQHYPRSLSEGMPASTSLSAGIHVAASASGTAVGVPFLPIPPPATASHSSQDRRVDDLRVQHRGGSSTAYSISLTYHDAATGSSRTIATQSLPPLSCTANAPPSGLPGGLMAAEDSATSTTAPGHRSAVVVKTPRKEPVLPSSLGPAPRAGCRAAPPPLATTAVVAAAAEVADGTIALAAARTPPRTTAGVAASKRPFGAPLPAMAPTAGPRLEGVAGRRGELVIGAFLGGGACGKVYECLNTETGQLLAAKQIVFDAKDPKLRQRLRQLEIELEVLTLATKQGFEWIVGFLGAEKRGHSVLMYLEYCEHGSLLDYLANGNSHDAAAWGVAGNVPPPPLPSVMLYSRRREALPTSADAVAAVSVGTGSTVEPDGHPPVLTTSLSVQCQRPSSSTVLDGERDLSWGSCSSHTITNTTWSTSIPALSSFDASSCGEVSEAMRPQMPPLSLREVQQFTREIVLGLSFLHERGYAHLDVKTANILVTADDCCRLADLGCAMRLSTPQEAEASGGIHSRSRTYRVLHDPQAITELRGTALYMAPEMIRFERHRIGSPADVWSLGCVVMELATGSAPWRHVARDKLRVLYRIGSAREELPLPPLLVAWAEEAEDWLSQWGEAMPSPLRRGPAGEPPVPMPSSARPASHVPTPHPGGLGGSIPITPGSPAAAYVADHGFGWPSSGDREWATAEREALTMPVEAGAASREEGKGRGPVADESESYLTEERRLRRLYVALTDFVQCCVSLHPGDRWTAVQLLEHPFLKL